MKFSKNEIIAFDFLYILCGHKGTAIGSNGKKKHFQYMQLLNINFSIYLQCNYSYKAYFYH